MAEFHPLITVQPGATRRRRRRAKALAVVGIAILAVVGLLTVARAHHGFVLVNGTSSEPPGLYVRAAGDSIRRGGLVAFMAPAAAFPYADQRAAFLHRTPIIKAVAAMAGDHVCTMDGTLIINGVRVAPILARDAHDLALPRWIACRVLAPGELFAFSNRVPNSFDSRYFGPVRAALAEPYRPLITTNGIGR
jgi:conjugative transfer signal peptidase TraF